MIDGAGAVLIGHRCLFSIYRLFIGQRFRIPSCILVLDRNGVSFCRFLFKIGFISIDKLFLGLGRSLRISMRILIAGDLLVFGIIEHPFFIVGELALGGIAILICYFSQIRDPIRRDGGSTIMLFTGCCFQLIIFQVDLAYIELAIDRQVFLYGDIFLKCCFAFRGQCALERGRASDFQIAADDSILFGRDRFSRQILHIFDIALIVHFDNAFDGGLSLLRVPCDTAGPIIGVFDSIFTILNFLVDLLFQLRIFRFQSTNIGLRCRHFAFQGANIRFGNCHTARKVSQGCLCGCCLGVQLINSRFIRINFCCIRSDLTIQLILCCSNLSLKICLRRIQCSRSGKFSISICFRVDIG